MNREELLTKAAMEWPAWPHGDRAHYPGLPGSWCWQFNGAGEASVRHSKHSIITLQDWLAERERLINRPGWDEAPEGATVLVQDNDGYWHFGRCPDPDYPQAKDNGNWESGPGGKWLSGVSRRKGKFPAGHSWTLTLERRPTEEFDSEARMTVIATNGNDGLHYPQSSGGMKFDSEKPRMDLLLADMPRALTEVGKVLTFGAAKYAPGNWIHVENAEQRYRAAGLRHDLALSMGEQNDSETGLHHLAHEACCVLFRLELALRKKEAIQ